MEWFVWKISDLGLFLVVFFIDFTLDDHLFLRFDLRKSLMVVMQFLR